MKIHHSLTDGIGGMQIAAEIVDFEREGTDRGPLPGVPGHFSGGFGPFPEQMRASCAVPVHNPDAWEAGQRRAIPLRGAENPYPIEPNPSTGIF